MGDKKIIQDLFDLLGVARYTYAGVISLLSAYDASGSGLFSCYVNSKLGSYLWHSGLPKAHILDCFNSQEAYQDHNRRITRFQKTGIPVDTEWIEV